MVFKFIIYADNIINEEHTIRLREMTRYGLILNPSDPMFVILER